MNTEQVDHNDSLCAQQQVVLNQPSCSHYASFDETLDVSLPGSQSDVKSIRLHHESLGMKHCWFYLSLKTIFFRSRVCILI